MVSIMITDLLIVNIKQNTYNLLNTENTTEQGIDKHVIICKSLSVITLIAIDVLTGNIS